MERDDFESAMGNVEARFGYRFVSRRELLREALTSGAYAAMTPDLIHHHGRLAFLGDAVLYLIVTEDALRHAPTARRGERVRQGTLTDARKSMVEDAFLAKLALRLQIQLPTRPRQAQDEGKGDVTRFATTMEAIIGAIYEDTQRNLARTADVVLPVLRGD